MKIISTGFQSRSIPLICKQGCKVEIRSTGFQSRVLKLICKRGYKVEIRSTGFKNRAIKKKLKLKNMSAEKHFRQKREKNSLNLKSSIAQPF